MSIVHRRNLIALLFALLLNAHGKVLGEDLTWNNIRTNLSNGSDVMLQNSVDAYGSDVQVTGGPTLTIGGGYFSYRCNIRSHIKQYS